MIYKDGEILEDDMNHEDLETDSMEGSCKGPRGDIDTGEGEARDKRMQKGDQTRFKCDSALLNALSKYKYRDKVLEIESIVSAFVTGSNDDVLTFSPDLARSTFDRLLIHRISQYWGLCTSVDKSNCFIVATRLHGKQGAPVMLKDIEVAMEENKTGSRCRQRRRQPDDILSHDTNRTNPNVPHQGASWRKSRSSRHKEGEYEVAKARIFNGQYVSQMVMPPVGFSGYPPYPQPQELPVKAQRRNHQRDAYDPDFRRHTSRGQSVVGNGTSMFLQQPMEMMHPVYPSVLGQQQMAPVMMHPFSIPVSPAPYPTYGFVPMIGPEGMLYQQQNGIPNRGGTAYAQGMPYSAGRHDPRHDTRPPGAY